MQMKKIAFWVVLVLTVLWLIGAGHTGLIIWFAIFALIARWLIKRHQYNMLGYEPYREANQLALAQFGDSQEERTQAIDKFFDEKTGSLTEFVKEKKGFRTMKLKFGRAIAAMPGREREALRACFHLANEGLFGGAVPKEAGKYNCHNFCVSRARLTFGGGKATLYESEGDLKVRLLGDATSAESSVSHVLEHLQGALERNPDNKVLKKLQERLLGGGTQSLSATDGFAAAPEGSNKPAFVLGDSEATGKPVRWDGEGSAITVAPPGSGKTQCHVFPTMLTWKGPAVVLDVKGEIYAGTSKWRAENVGPVYKFSPLDPGNSHKYNPLTLVRSDPDYLWEDSRFLADMMMVPTGAKDPFWENRARDILTAAIARACLTDDPAKRRLDGVIDVFHGVGWDDFVRDLQARVDIRSMTRAGSSLGEMEAKTRDGVLQTGLSSLSAWDGDRIARATSQSDWSPLDLRNGTNPTVYICLKPNEVESYISVLRVFIAQHIRALTSELPKRESAPILFLLDELPRLRQMPPVEEALEIGRQYGIKLWMFTQSVGQMTNAYPNGDGMIGSCSLRMYMNPSLHDETAQKISDDIGYQESVLDGTRQKIVEPAVLAGPDYKDYAIVMAAGTKPFRVKKHFAWQDPALSARMGSL